MIQNMLALRLLYSSILVCLKIWSMLKHRKITLTNRQEKKRHGRFSTNEENSVFYHKHAMKKILDFLRGKWTTQTFLFLCMMFYHRAADNLFASLGITSKLLLKGVKAPAGNYEQKETKVDINAVFSINFISMAVEMKIDIGHQHFLPIRSYSCGFCAIKIFLLSLSYCVRVELLSCMSCGFHNFTCHTPVNSVDMRTCPSCDRLVKIYCDLMK